MSSSPLDISEVLPIPAIEAAPTLIIGEIAQAHDGSLGTAHAYIDAIAQSGADAVKFQTHIAAAESTPQEPWRTKFSKQDATRYDYWKRMEFTDEQWAGLKKHCDERGVAFLSSPFSIEAVRLLEGLGMSAWKIASGEVGNLPMLDRILASGGPVLLSSGMSPLSELDQAVDKVRATQVPFAILQCTSSYPCLPEDVGLNQIVDLRKRYGCPTGLSDHSGTTYPSLAATTLGARVVEVHVSMSRNAFGPDVAASVTVDEFRNLVEGVRFIGQSLANPVDKDEAAERLEPLRRMFSKSVVAERDLPAGTVLTESHLSVKKPGTGIPAARINEIIGRRLRHDVVTDHLIAEEDLEDAR